MPVKSIALLLFILFLTFIVPLLFHVDATSMHVDAILLPPSTTHWMGTDRLGRDLFARVLLGGQVSLIVGFASALIASLIGLISGTGAAMLGSKADKLFVIIIDLFLSFPTFFLLLALASYMSASLWVLVFIIAVTGWMTTARLIRSESYKIAKQPYIDILHMANVPHRVIIFKYFLPLLSPIFLVAFTLGVGGAILAESGLSFLGLGIIAPQMSWGTILADGKAVIDIAWWVSFFPGLMIFLVTFSLMTISNALQQLANQKESLQG